MANDWTVMVGYDDSAVVAGIKNTQKMIDSLKVPTVRMPSVTGGESTGNRVSENTRLNFLNQVENFATRTGRALKDNAQEAAKFTEKVEDLKKEITSASNTKRIQQLRRAFKTLQTNTQGVIQDVKRLNQQMTLAERVAKGFKDSINNLVRSYGSLYAAIDVGHRIFVAGKEMDSLAASMLAASEDANEAATNMQFVRETARGLGVDLIAAGKGYTKIATAAREANFTTEQAQEIFLAASESARTFGLNTERTNLVFLAFSQILSKGKVSMEELRRQLGEQLPGVLNIAAKAMNVNVQELERMIQAGLSADEFMLKFSRTVRSTVRENGALQASTQKVEASQQKMATAFAEFSDALFKAGLADLLKGFFDFLSDSLQALTVLFKAISVPVQAFNGWLEELNMKLFGVADQVTLVSLALKVLAAFLISRMIPAGMTFTTVMTGMATATWSFAGALRAVGIALKSIGRIIGIGLAFEALGFVLDKTLFKARNDFAEGTNVGGGTTINQTNNFNTANNQADIEAALASVMG